MEYVIKDREPRLALRYFEELSAIPRGSYNEKAAAEFVYNEAKRLGLWARIDDKYCVVVRVPASAGAEDKPALLLQAHLDMVCEKNRDTVHDFTKDGLKLRLNGSILTAEGTTLGADDGMGVAYMMDFMAQDVNSFPHPPLELCFTTCEEVGFDGALAMDFSCFEARNMIGLDAGPEGETYTTSAGAQSLNFTRTVTFEQAEGDALAVEIRGLLGGHSAVNIADEKANSNKVLGRILHNILKKWDVRLSSVSGGSKMNAIPREADALLVAPAGTAKEVTEEIARLAAEIREEYAVTDPGIKVNVLPAAAKKAMTKADTEAIVNALFCIPNGVRMMSKEIEGLPVTSTNMGVITQEDSTVTINTFLRSSDKTLCADYVDHMSTVANLCGLKAEAGPLIPGWKYVADSKMRQLAARLYKEQTGKDMKFVAVHGGLELGVFVDHLPGLDIVCIGPDGGDVHTVTEWLDLDSFARSYEHIKMVMAELTK